MSFKICISEPKTKKTFQIEKEAPSLSGLKIGQKFDGTLVGLNGFTLQVTGGSDKCGFPMRSDVEGTVRKKILMHKGIGFSGFFKTKKGFRKIKGVRKRKYVCGNQLGEHLAQINCKAVSGEGDIGLILGIAPKEKKEEEKK